jgi:hypothetical protein
VETIVIAVAGPTDRLLLAGLRRVSPVLDELGPGAMIIGGLMVRLWLHARPIDLPARATPDIDLGIDKRVLRISGTKRVIGPLLEEHGFEPGYRGEPFRYFRNEEGLGTIIVDLVIARDASRRDPPLLEHRMETVRAPGLVYAQLRQPVALRLRFVDGGSTFELEVHTARLDAAFVLKAALAQSGLRTQPDRLQSDSVDAIMLAAACLRDPESLEALSSNRARGDVRKALRWIEHAFRSPTAVGARRMETHLEDEGAGSGGGVWAHATAIALARELAVGVRLTEP